ncbi:hypothetical protein SAMN05421505_101229 [Sinosporangium album]|uniref:Uncharacterized protein n=1 Tax=Sinosporangium album TaxID=504805 RepID=A0A1G7R2Z9_9ACTN|nr:hypothetical protein [Sinosporangium album]SDG05171.1 hypothetical protein SAMN05421505_101229 [Sinosporangium album]
MPDTGSFLSLFAAAARQHADLSVDAVALSSEPAYVSVSNRFSNTLSETVTCCPEGNFLTSWGYRLGDVANIDDAASRLAYLLAALPH